MNHTYVCLLKVMWFVICLSHELPAPAFTLRCRAPSVLLKWSRRNGQKSLLQGSRAASTLHCETGTQQHPWNMRSGKRPTLKLQDYEIYTRLCPPVVICLDSVCVFLENMAETVNVWPVCSFPHILTDMFASFPVSVVWLLLVYLLFCSRLTSARAASICTSTHASCHVLSLANLFDRVIQHSTRMHSITNDLHSEFVSCIWTPRGWSVMVSVKRSFFS